MRKPYANSALLQYYFGPGTSTHRVMGAIQGGYNGGVCRRIDVNLIGKAASEIQRKRKTLDEATYPFAQVLGREQYGGQTRVVIIIAGKLIGTEGEITSTIGADLGRNPHRLFGSGELRIDVPSIR